MYSGPMDDSVADVLSLLGDRWALRVVRDVALGHRRFDELADRTAAPRTVLSDRLRRLVEAQILTTRPYQVPGRRTQQEYVLTDAGIDLVPVLAALSDWGDRHLGQRRTSPEVVYRHSACGGQVSAALRCECGQAADPHAGVVAEVRH